MNKKIIAAFLGITLITGYITYGFLHPKIASAACGNGYGFCNTVTTDHTKAGSSTTANFAMLFSTSTMSSLATVGNGGKVQNTTTQTGGGASLTVPADLVFTSDSACTTALPFEWETWNSATGASNVWVNIGTLSNVSDVVIYLCYGNVSVTTYQGNVNGTWDSSYKGVWHLPDGSSLSLNDSTSNANNGTNNGTTAAAGQIDGSSAMSGSSQYIDAGTGASLNVTTGITLQAWVKPTDFGNFRGLISHTTSGKPQPYDWYLGLTSGLPTFYEGNGSTFSNANGLSAPTTGVWSQLVLTYSAAAGSGHVTHYLNGANNGGPTTISDVTAGGVGHMYIGTRDDFITMMKGGMDEVRVSSVARSADQVLAEYNNQLSPNTFYTIGAQQTGSGAAAQKYTSINLGIKGATFLGLPPSTSQLTIARDATTASSTSAGGATSLTFQATTTGTSGLGLFVMVTNDSGDPTGITYNGVAMTELISHITTGFSGVNSIWFLANPATGAHNVAISVSGSQKIFSVATSYTGVSPTQPDSSGTLNEAFRDPPFNVPTIVVNASSWLLGIANGAGTNVNMTATGGTTLGSISNFFTTPAGVEAHDSNGTVGSGSHSLGWVDNGNSGGSGIVISIAPKINVNTSSAVIFPGN